MYVYTLSMRNLGFENEYAGQRGGHRLNKVIWLYQRSWKCKLGTVTIWKADVSSVSPSSERMPTQHHSFFRNFHPYYII